MGGNDTHDKYGRPYELDDSKEHLYDKLNDLRDEIELLKFKIQYFRDYLGKEMDDCSPSASIEFAQTNEIQENFNKIFDGW